MRKTSHDGIDATSITSGIENEIKKAGTNISKIKKSSIKRKVQNFSHETDEGIIEPLLQIEKQKSEIANRSAKYLLNKSKTDSSYERINKSSDNFAFCTNTISTSVSSANKVINKDNKLSTSSTSETTTMHNHMNTNVFGTYDVSKGIIATKSPILVEIDGSKSGAYSPSPLIFTTAKIHTDSKTKLMEPVQTTPVPILSTIEGTVVKTLPNNSEQSISSFSKKSVDQNITQACKSESNELPSIAGKSLFAETVTSVSSKEETLNSKGVSNTNECNNKNVKESQGNLLSKTSASAYVENQNASQLSNKNSKTIFTTTNSVNFSSKISSDEICTDKSSKEAIVTTTSHMTLADKSVSTEKNKGSVVNSSENKAVKSNAPVPLDLHNISSNKIKDMKSPKAANSISPVSNSENEEKMVQVKKLTESKINDVKDNINTIKVPVTSGNKKLQRQKNTPLEEISDSIMSSPFGKSDLTHDSDKKSTQKAEEIGLNKIDYKEESTSLHDKKSTNGKTTAVVENLITTKPSQSKPTECIIATTTKKIKSTTDMLNIKPATFGTFVDVSKLQPSKISAIATTGDNIKSTTSTTSLKSQPSSRVATESTSVMATASKPDSCNQISTTTKADLSIKCESSVVTTTLPSYIVSTSKTKIGGTLATSTLTSTSKSLTQKPFAEIVYTASGRDKNVKVTEKNDRSPSSTSSSSTKHPNFSQKTKSKTDSLAKDGRA